MLSWFAGFDGLTVALLREVVDRPKVSALHHGLVPIDLDFVPAFPRSRLP
jgi:hypothetical protein